MELFLTALPSITVDPQHRSFLFHGRALEHNGDDAHEIVIYAGAELMGLGKISDNQLKISTRLVDK